MQCLRDKLKVENDPKPKDNERRLYFSMKGPTSHAPSNFKATYTTVSGKEPWPPSLLQQRNVGKDTLEPVGLRAYSFIYIHISMHDRSHHQ